MAIMAASINAFQCLKILKAGKSQINYFLFTYQYVNVITYINRTKATVTTAV